MRVRGRVTALGAADDEVAAGELAVPDHGRSFLLWPWRHRAVPGSSLAQAAPEVREGSCPAVRGRGARPPAWQRCEAGPAPLPSPPQAAPCAWPAWLRQALGSAVAARAVPASLRAALPQLAGVTAGDGSQPGWPCSASLRPVAVSRTGPGKPAFPLSCVLPVLEVSSSPGATALVYVTHTWGLVQCSGKAGSAGG